ncbi:hypothetical protein THAOC_06638 [Thalassiosira oceanica]|uniref:Uncharacterized protein n=1 Tax=Thalassiosira oceanica TaxID=159749 RepID=K0T271_THAOC|nr:hypothetical protein THAOC_06638 [Thalassiosira oceanica]|eukprot:EJK71880.1 hypothetical protein THAOC_06638 [Thalassiosira oceanica]
MPLLLSLSRYAAVSATAMRSTKDSPVMAGLRWLGDVKRLLPAKNRAPQLPLRHVHAVEWWRQEGWAKGHSCMPVSVTHFPAPTTPPPPLATHLVQCTRRPAVCTRPAVGSWPAYFTTHPARRTGQPLHSASHVALRASLFSMFLTARHHSLNTNLTLCALAPRLQPTARPQHD